MSLRLPALSSSAHLARSHAAQAVRALGRDDLADDVASVVSELVANAVMHARTDLVLTVELSNRGIRVAVADGSAVIPRFAGADVRATNGRGLLIIDRLSASWGVDRLVSGKAVWVVVDEPFRDIDEGVDDGLAHWANDADEDDEMWSPDSLPVRVDLDVDDLVESRHETDNLVRDMQLLGLDAAARKTGDEPQDELVDLARQLDVALDGFDDGRRQIRQQALAAQRSGVERVTLELHLAADAGQAAQRFLDAVESADALTEQGKLLVPPSTQTTRDVRRHYVEAIIEQLASTARAQGNTRFASGQDG